MMDISPKQVWGTGELRLITSKIILLFSIINLVQMSSIPRDYQLEQCMSYEKYFTY